MGIVPDQRVCCRLSIRPRTVCDTVHPFIAKEDPSQSPTVRSGVSEEKGGFRILFSLLFLLWPTQSFFAFPAAAVTPRFGSGRKKRYSIFLRLSIEVRKLGIIIIY